MRIRLRDWIEERNERTTVSDQHPVLTCSQDGILLQSAYFKKQIASQDNTGYKIVHRGDFTYRAMSDTGRFYIHQMDCAEIGIVSPAYPVFYLKDGAPIVPEYLLLFFESELFHELVSSKSKGSTRLSLRMSKIGDITVEFPEVDEQNKRVALMNSLSQQIEDVSRREKSYDDTVKSLFNEMFGDPNENPKGFPVTTIRKASKVLMDGPFGSNLKSSHYVAEGVRVIRLQNIGSGEFLDDDKAFISMEHYENLKRYTCKPGDIVVGTLGNPNLRACIIPDTVPLSINKSDCVHIIADPKKFEHVFLAQYLNMPAVLDMALNLSLGETRARISSGRLSTLAIYMPPLELQKEFEVRKRQIDKLRFNAIKQKELFTEYRSSFLQDFFEGGNKHE